MHLRRMIDAPSAVAGTDEWLDALIQRGTETCQLRRMTLEQHVPVTVTLQASGHPADGVHFTTFDINLDEVDRAHASRVEQDVESDRFALEVRRFGLLRRTRKSPVTGVLVEINKPTSAGVGARGKLQHINLFQ